MTEWSVSFESHDKTHIGWFTVVGKDRAARLKSAYSWMRRNGMNPSKYQVEMKDGEEKMNEDG